HHGLLLCWKIREGFKKNISLERMKNYTDWFWKNHLMQHFGAEEKYIFPVLPADHEFVKKALAEHRRLKRLFENETEISRSLSQIEEELESHIRFEERILFNEVQLIATQEQLEAIEKHHNDLSPEAWEDEFWL